MTTVRAPTRRFEQRKSAIIVSAVDVLNRKGVRGMTLADVATRLGLVPTGVIYYFKNKEELASACFLDGVDRYNALATAAAKGGDVRERLQLFLDAYFDLRRRIRLGETPPLVAFNDVRALNCAPVNAAYVDMFRRLRALLEGRESRGLSKTALSARAQILISEVLWAPVWLPRHDPEDFGRVSQRVLSITADGLAAPGAPWNPVALPKLIQGAEVEKISARLNVTKGAFYHHNDTKDELVVACFERTFEVMRRAIRQAEEVATSGLQVLTTVASALVEHQMTGDVPLLRASALSSAPEALQPQMIAQFDRLSDRFASLISDGIADGSVRPLDVNIGAQMLTAMINAAAELHHWAPGVTPQTVAALYVRPFFEGLLSRQA